MQSKLKPKVTESVADDPGKKGQKIGSLPPYLSPYDLVKNTQHTYVGISGTTNACGPDSKRQKITVWPEWNDADVNAEKWESAHKVKEEKKGKPSVMQQQHFFDDPDGKVEMPPSLRVYYWRRPYEFITDKTPVVVDVDHMLTDFDLLTMNDHLYGSELMRHIISIITSMWELGVNKNTTDAADPSIPGDDPTRTWRPWEHIYSLCKVAKHHIPLYNTYGKYVVRLYWMGWWRKIIVDDLMPFDEQDRLLLPMSTISHELWPMLLTKAIIKIASLDYSGGKPDMEFGDISILHSLTSWLPEAIQLHHGHYQEIWELLKLSLPQWHLPEPENDKCINSAIPGKKEGASLVENPKEEKPDASQSKSDKQDKSKDGGKDKGAKDNKGGVKDDKKEKEKKEKEKSRFGNIVSACFGVFAAVRLKLLEEKGPMEESFSSMKPEIVVFATFGNTSKYPAKVSILGEMADASEHLRQNGLSDLYPHSVFITQTRSCPLEKPPPPEIIPAWKLIRPRKNPEPPSDEPKLEPVPPKDIRFLEITSPFVNYKVSHVPIPTCVSHATSGVRSGSHLQPFVKHSTVKEVEDSTPRLRSAKKSSASVADVSVDVSLSTPTGQESVTGSGAKRKAAGKLLSNGNTTTEKSSAPGRTSKQSELRSAKDRVKGPPSEASPYPSEAISDITAKQSDHLEVPDSALMGSDSQMEAPKPKKVWIDFDQFCVCFSTLFIFHKHSSYGYNQRHSDLKHVISNNVMSPVKADKKQPTTAPGGLGPDDKTQYFLFVDSLHPTDVVISFSVLPRWFEQSASLMDEKIKIKEGKSKDYDKDLTIVSSNSVIESCISRENAPPPPVTPGTLVAEPYSWKSLVMGQPILRIRTTGTRAAVLSLPAGRHVLRFMMTSPLSHHVHLCSTVNIVFGDEETVMQQLTHESCRFRENAMHIMTNLARCISSFSDAGLRPLTWKLLTTSHFPYSKNKLFSKRRHFQMFNEALYMMLRKGLREVGTPEIAFAWRAFNFETIYPNILALTFGSRPATGSASAQGSLKPTNLKKQLPQLPQLPQPLEGEPEKPEYVWASRYVEPTPEEHAAAVKLQKVWRGLWVRKIKRAHTAGTDENLKAQELLMKSWTMIEVNAEENGEYLLREMIKKDPDSIQHYSFYKDEWNKISYADYRGIYPDQPAQQWFIIFREIFLVREETQVVPRLYISIPTCMLRVVDNDTGQEVPRVFQKVAPYVYKPNKKGYTFVAEARTLDQPLMSGPWRMRLIGSFTPLPSPRTSDVNSHFQVKDLRDYYVPNAKNIIFRYTVKVTEEQICSLQVSTSKPDVYVRLSILDNEEEVASAVGKGHVVIPAFIFQKDPNMPGDVASNLTLEIQKSNSHISNRGGAKAALPLGKVKQVEPAKNEGRNSRNSSSETAASDELEEKESKPHKYIIQATVLHNSWPLSENSWIFVQGLKEQEKNDLKVAIQEIHLSPPKSSKSQHAASSKGKATKPPKVKEEKVVKEKVPESKISATPALQFHQFDATKPHWMMRIVVDAIFAEEIEVKKDTERADEIRALKRAWEKAEPGRAAKALKSRLKYLSTHTIKIQPNELSAESGNEDHTGCTSAFQMDTEAVLTLEPPPAPSPCEILQPLDITPFVRKTLETPRLLDEAEAQRLLEERQKQILQFKEHRQQVEAWRAQDRALRNQMKLKQLDDAQALQTSLDIAREAINIPREAFRQRYLEAERRRLEELASQEAALRADGDSKNPKGKKNFGGKKK